MLLGTTYGPSSWCWRFSSWCDVYFITNGLASLITSRSPICFGVLFAACITGFMWFTVAGSASRGSGMKGYHDSKTPGSRFVNYRLLAWNYPHDQYFACRSNDVGLLCSKSTRNRHRSQYRTIPWNINQIMVFCNWEERWKWWARRNSVQAKGRAGEIHET